MSSRLGHSFYVPQSPEYDAFIAKMQDLFNLLEKITILLESVKADLRKYRMRQPPTPGVPSSSRAPVTIGDILDIESPYLDFQAKQNEFGASNDMFLSDYHFMNLVRQEAELKEQLEQVKKKIKEIKTRQEERRADERIVPGQAEPEARERNG